MHVAKAKGKTTEEARTAVVYVRITRTEREELRALATREQRTLGEWARLVLLSKLPSPGAPKRRPSA